MGDLCMTGSGLLLTMKPAWAKFWPMAS